MRDLMKTKAYKNLRDLLIHWGFTNMEASIYALMALSQKPMGAREIAEKLNRAYSSVVNELNKLLRYGIVERSKGDRCYQYSAVIDLIGIIHMERRKLIRMLSNIKDSLESMRRERYGDFINHLEEALEYLGRLEREV